LLHLVPKAVDAGDPGAGPPVPEGTVVGDPAHVLDAIRHWESIGVDQVNVIVNALEVIPQADVLASLRLFAAEVMPAFRPTTAPAPPAPAPASPAGR
jgi:hypothetical protein